LPPDYSRRRSGKIGRRNSSCVRASERTAGSEYTSDRTGPAPDNKWQFVARDEFKTMAVDGKRKVIKCGRGSQSVASLISVTLAHEIEGHVLQHENKSKIPLRLFKRLGSGRSVVFAECGAMSNQDTVSRDAFVRSPPHLITSALCRRN
jgi:hypothetical protein